MPMPYNERLTEALAFVAKLVPASRSAGAVNVPSVQLTQGKKALFIVNGGSKGASGTLDFKLQSSATSGGTYADIAGAAIAQIVADDKFALLEIRGETLVGLGVGPWVRGVLTTGVNAVLSSVEVILAPTDYSPASLLNSGVDQTVVV